MPKSVEHTAEKCGAGPQANSFDYKNRDYF